MLPKELQTRLATEFRFAVDRMKEVSDFESKIYFFSVFYGEPQRLFNLYWDASLALLADVIQSAATQMAQKPRLPAETTPLLQGVPVGWIEALEQVSDELASVFEADEVDEQRLYQAVARVAELGYVLTGNGFYLFMKGQIKI